MTTRLVLWGIQLTVSKAVKDIHAFLSSARWMRVMRYEYCCNAPAIAALQVTPRCQPLTVFQHTESCASSCGTRRGATWRHTCAAGMQQIGRTTVTEKLTCQAVKATRGVAAACSKDVLSGMSAICFSLMQTFSAYDPAFDKQIQHAAEPSAAL